MATGARASVRGPYVDILLFPTYLHLCSTLRFADRVKQVKNQARINYDPAHSRLIELMAECDALRAERDALRTANAELQSKVRDWAVHVDQVARGNVKFGQTCRETNCFESLSSLHFNS